MMSKPSISVLAISNTVEASRNLVSSIRLCGLPNIEIVVLAPDFMVRESHLLGPEWEGVSIRSRDKKLDNLVELDTDYVLVIPPANTVSISGLYAAAAMLEEDKGLSEVGGLCVDLDGLVESGAFKELYRDPDKNVAVAPIETTRPLWLKSGPFAATSADFLGGLSLVRRAHLAGRHYFNGSLPARALACPDPENYKALVFSGLVMTTVSGFDLSYGEDGDVEVLPADAYTLWKNCSKSEVRVLHQGHALRNDDLEKVFFFADRRIRAVDDRPTGGSARAGHYYKLPSTTSQLGYGSRVALGQALQVNRGLKKQEVGDFSTPEENLLRLARRLVARVPEPVVRLVIRAIERLS
ncbi:hypothetical protein IMCC13023_03600 [Candidatus Aquiluna sp. IMCC13023]|uniref:hypothetical protein n=1 Tax=Candidatus Aquiluna sp. IMCC13023 TaxID=1081644 RepID=UPI00025B20C5|nr:hypothetical protein [Candidatus Aquiluna sp. IMCC13023]EIC91881.1 hypothetical protein IMCC13023_03600 [Candidatus Aquiluna sp. IMCC13023]